MPPPHTVTGIRLGHSPPPRRRVQILHVPDCPLVEDLRAILRRTLARSGTAVEVEDLEGPYPSPTLLIDGTDVTGRSFIDGPACRLDLPTEEQILAALAPPPPSSAAPLT